MEHVLQRLHNCKSLSGSDERDVSMIETVIDSGQSDSWVLAQTTICALPIKNFKFSSRR